ncbi:MAG: hypothetical protein HY942_01430 [Gammaproteobacteria bacterium]|nr:hypothetical protein [Gammaproteobacteria bacterium]
MLTVLLTACAGVPRATLLEFSEQENGGEAYVTRMLVTDEYLRIDDGQGGDGFILLDRRARTIYSVSHADKTVLVIAPRAIELPPPAVFEHVVERDIESYPPVAGRPVRRYTLLTNKQRCLEVFAADGLLPGAVAALREYQKILAGEQAFTAARRPKELQNDCALADDVFVPARYLGFGFPVKQTTYSGKARDLIDFRTGVAAEHGLFEVPAGYRRYTLHERSAG